jgi:hypothetical protein
MHATKLPKLLAATALAVVALGATPLAQAGLGAPQKHPDIIAVKHPDIIAIKHPDIIAVKHPDIIAIKHPDRLGGLKFTLGCRKAGGVGGY